MAKDAMLYTNGKILISSVNDADALHKGVRKLENFLFEEHGKEAKFVLDDTRKYPCYLVPAGVNWAEIDKALRPKVALKAIDEEIMLAPEKKEVDYRYTYTPEELEQMSTEMSNDVLKRKELMIEKSSVMARYGAELKALNKAIDDLARGQVDGYTDKQILCQVRYNFSDGTKYFVDANDADNIIKAEPMEPKDYQLRIDTTREAMFNPDEVDSAAGDGFLPFGDDDDEAAPTSTTPAADDLIFPEHWDEGDKINYGINQMTPEEREAMTGSRDLIELPEGEPTPRLPEPEGGYAEHTGPADDDSDDADEDDDDTVGDHGSGALE